MKYINKKPLLCFLAITLAFSLFLCSCRTKEQTESASEPNYVYSLPTAPEASEEPVSSDEPVDNGIRLVISSPAKTSLTVTDPVFTFTGTSDPAEPLTVNGAEIPRGEDGVFAYQTELNVGKNSFSFAHKGETKTYTIRYRYVIINSFAPSGAQTYPSGSTVVVNASARKGSTVQASFNGQTIDLTRENPSDEDTGDFVSYNGVFHLPSDNAQDLNLGKISFTASHGGKSETFTSGNITCKKSDIIIDYDPNATPTGGKYINVGSGYIAEIVEYNAETFDGNVTDAALKDGSVDWSRPTNNYLPKGTLDYCSSSYVNYKDINYVTLRAGYRVYLERQDKPREGKKPVVRQYIGTLPDHNEVAAAEYVNNGSHTVITFNTLWKAPFYFDLLPQSYVNPSAQNYLVNSVTYNYVDITFCYATVFTGEIVIPEDDPLFKSAQIIENKTADGTGIRDYTVRLFLKKQGAFYGWDSYYNENDQLCFEFLNPKAVTSNESEYGVNLDGAKILIDVGHGGIDIGAPGFDSKNHNEAIQNLFLANKIKAELESIGAEVFLTRSDNSTSSTDDKITLLKSIKPDFCLAIHHNSNPKASPNGFGAYYFDAFSAKAAEYIYYQTQNSTSIYKDFIFKWHYYFMCRTTNCPVVLTENGFMSNSYDYGNIVNEEANLQKAKAITRGIADYFKSIQ